MSNMNNKLPQAWWHDWARSRLRQQVETYQHKPRYRRKPGMSARQWLLQALLILLVVLIAVLCMVAMP